MKLSRFPDPLVLIFGLLVLTALLSAVVPAGLYARLPVPGKEHKSTVVVGSYRTVAELRAEYSAAHGSDAAFDPLKLPSAAALPPGANYPMLAEERSWIAAVASPLLAIPKGLAFEDTRDIVFLVFIVGGVIAILRRTGAIDALLGSGIRLLGGTPILFVSGMMLLFVVGSSTIGMAEEYVPFVPILTAMCLVLKLDAVVALGMLYMGAGIGYGCAIMNPFTVIPARNIAGIAEPEGAIWVRLGLTVAMVAIGTHHLISYARKVQADPTKSLVHDVDYSKGFEPPKDTRMTKPRAAILLIFAAMLAIFAYGSNAYGFYIIELSAMFLALGVIAAAIGRLSPNETGRVFGHGAAEMTMTALLIGVARGTEVLLDEAQIKDTIVHGIASLMPSDPGHSWVAAIAMLILQSITNLLIPSGSGQAYVTMPIMGPLASVTGVGRETAVLAYQFGDGLTNMIVPTNSLLMGMLVLAKIPYVQWLRFILPFLMKVYVLCIAAVVVGAMMKWGG